MKKLLLAGAFLLSFSTSALAQEQMTPYNEMPAGTYSLDKTHASLVWKVSHAGLSNYTARFTDFDANLTFDPNNVENSTLVATINPTSIETDYPNPEKTDFNKELSQGEQWLNAQNFPEITFESTAITKTSENTGTMTGNLTFLGVTKPVTLDVVFNGAMAEQPFSKLPTLGFSATGSIKRSEWGLNTYVPAIGDRVDIAIEAELAKKS